MLRVMRLPLASLRPEFREGFLALPAFLQSLNVNPEAKSLIANYQIDGDYVNFFVLMQGGVEVLPCGAGGPQFTPQQSTMQVNFENRRTALLNTPVDPSNPAAAFLRTLLQNPQYMVTVDQSIPVLIPFVDNHAFIAPMAGAAAAGVAAASTATAAATAGRSLGGLLWTCLLVLLLCGSFFAYYKLLYPWPFQNEQKIAEFKRQKELELLDQKLAFLIDKTDMRLEHALLIAGQREAQGALGAYSLLANLQAKDQEAAIAAAQQAQKEAEDEAAKAKAEAEQMAKEKAEAEAERLAKEKAEAERLAKEKAEAERLAQEKAAAAAKSKATQTATTTAAAKSLPKCETIKKQGKLPLLLLALDGSGSMTNTMSDGKTRMESAFKAANTLIDRIDKNVDIHAYGIQGCPFARDIGVFSSGSRAQLKGALSGLDPRKFKNPGFVFTPLISALQAIGEAAPANVDSVAIVISDGLDSCYDGPKMTLCELAGKIHARKPQLKIHVVFLGNMDEFYDVQCVAKITNGQVYKPSNTSQLVKNIEQASQTLVKVCQ